MEDFVRQMMESLGPFGIALLMFLENIFPPIPSELIMPLAGYRATQGDMSIFMVILAGTSGSLLGILPWYFLGRMLGEQRVKGLAARHGRLLTLTPADVEAADKWFCEKGKLAVLFGRLVPTVRTLISLPAGIAKMNFTVFLIYSALGTTVWSGLLAFGGFLLGQAYDTISKYVDPVSTAVLVLMIAYYVYRVVSYQPQRQ